MTNPALNGGRGFLTEGVWITIRPSATLGVQRALDRAFKLDPAPGPYDILNAADQVGFGTPDWAMATFGLLPFEDVQPHGFSYGHASLPYGPLIIRNADHDAHFGLYPDTRAPSWAARAEIKRLYIHVVT